MACRAEAAWPAAAVSLQALDGRRGRFLQVAAFRGHRCIAIALSTWGMPAYPPGHSAVEGSEDGGGRQGASGRERGHPRLCQLLMHLREERHWGRARLWAATRSEKPICWPPARCSRLPGQAWPSALGLVRRLRQTPEGGSPTTPSSSEDVSPSPDAAINILSTDGGTELNAGRPVGQTSEITREPDGMFAAWWVRGPWGRARRRGSYSNPQISQSISRLSSARAREISTGGGRGCQSFHKGKARSQRTHAHTPTTDAWVIHERSFSVLEAQTLKTTIVSVIHRHENDCNQKDTDETASWKKKTRSSVICSFRICSLSWSAQGKRWWEGLHLSHRYANQEQNKN